ncbi:hypothetical protein [Streptomyces sp. G45]|uniref:hypothetical protein n=1 Tax=Streptomyces sp. G45 TaxID=3406627 RepID=UPI003C137042
MKARRLFGVAALLVMACGVTACAQDDGDGDVQAGQDTMNEQEARERAQDIVRQAVDGMAPKPTLKRVGPEAVGPCVARDDHGHDDRLQVSLTYQLTDVPGTAARKLVRQARDAWVEQGYTFKSADGDGDWAGPFPSVSMRSTPDDFWMEAITGVVRRAEGVGLASLSVTSPCFAPTTSSRADPATFAPKHVGTADESRVLGHSGRL